MISITNAELNTQLYRKMFAEQEQYRQQLLEMTPEEILRNAYEYKMSKGLYSGKPLVSCCNRDMAGCF